MDPEISRRRRKGFDFISQALSCEEEMRQRATNDDDDDDETADKEAYVLYKLGITELDAVLLLLSEGGAAVDEAMLERTRLVRKEAAERVKKLGKEEEPGSSSLPSSSSEEEDVEQDEDDTALEQHLEATIVDTSKVDVRLKDIIGMAKAKKVLREAVILPTLNPALFVGLRSPVQGLLLFGPPGNGKTFLMTALAKDSNATLFSVTGADLTATGQGDKAVKKLFEMARKRTPSIVFIDEIDSILMARSPGQSEQSRKLLNEFLTSFTGLSSFKEANVFVIGATNRPHELDSAAVSRFNYHVYIPLPDTETRKAVLDLLLVKVGSPLTSSDVLWVSEETSGYSFRDLTNLFNRAVLGPILEIADDKFITTTKEEVRRVQKEDFAKALTSVRASVTAEEIVKSEAWNKKRGDVSKDI